ncbi:hypothetical protein PGH46_15360 [Legionella pneumophila]|nr:hypothetical protein PGH46_15360 [Legionella pneumophila]
MDLASASKPIPTANKVPAKVHPASIARPTREHPRQQITQQQQLM